MGVCKYGSDVLFVHQDNVFFGLAECCVGECSEAIEAGLSLTVYVVCVWDERHAFVVCHSECCDRFSVGYGCVVECYCRLCAVFAGVGGD